MTLPPHALITGYAYPPPDDAVRDYLLSFANLDENDIETAYLYFFGKVFELVAHQIGVLSATGTEMGLASQMATYLSKNRTLLYSECIEDAREAIVCI